ncbi:MAG: 4Fe-4S binding protein, partial [Oscillospiraceae bacterium]|nr:4Fe-4S binding protein [Oscillospiraceae bacterium]
MEQLIITKPEKCVGCNACVRACPAAEANITKMYEDGRFITTIDPDHCIACGACINACTHGARDYIDDTEEAMAALAHDKLIIMAAPSIKTVFPTKWKGILDWFRSKGCIIYDVSFGADICTWAHLRTMEHNQAENIHTNMITQPCPSIVKYIEVYQPKLLQNLSPIHSPVACGVKYIKSYLRRTNPIAMLGPCIAKKFEFQETGLVEYNVTFKKLMEYFERNDIRISTNPVEDYEYKFDEMQGQLGSIYPRPGGLRDNLWLHNPDFNITNSEGVKKVYPELDLYSKMPAQKHPELFDVLSCEFGCNVGPGSGTQQNFFEGMAIMREIEMEAKQRRKVSGGLLRGAEDKLFKRFDEELRLADFIRSYRPTKPSVVPSEEQLEPIYKMMGKHTEEDRHYDCLACGYRSCRDMAIAIYRGLNTSDNCVIHAKTVLLARHSML